MFRKSKKEQQLTIFSNYSFLPVKSLKNFEDSNKWHNQFRIQITERIDEEIFRPLFCNDNGAPNSSIRLLIAMMILKEAQGWSESQLFENAQYNLLVRSALGLVNFDEPIPAESTYYLLRKRIVDRELADLGNLMEEVFASITKSQIMEFQINGNKIRLDSTLVGSNIAWYGRYTLIHETLRLAYTSAKSQIESFLTTSEIEVLRQLSIESGDNVSYHNNKSSLESRLIDLGTIIYKIITHTQSTDTKHLEILHRVFYEQYEIVDGQVKPLRKQSIKASSVQSPHDPDCHFRTKGETDVKGYSVNLTETCGEDNDVNLITNIMVEPATISDVDFLQPAIEATQSILQDKIESINSDGAYHNPENQDYCIDNEIDFILNALVVQPLDMNYQ